MTSSNDASTSFAWPGPDAPGLRIGDAAALLGTTVKAIRVYHERDLIPEPERDEAGYRRYDAHTLVLLARVVRLRSVGLSLRAIGSLVGADDDRGGALRATLQDLRETLDDEIDERRVRRSLVEDLLAEGIDDPLSVSTADVAEEWQIGFLRRLKPDLSVEEEAFERRMQRALAALGVAGGHEADGAADTETTERLLAATGGPAGVIDRHRRLFELRDAEPDDPRVEVLATDMRAVMQAALTEATMQAGRPASAAHVERPTTADVERWAAGVSAALTTLPLAVRRVWELVLTPQHAPSAS